MPAPRCALMPFGFFAPSLVIAILVPALRAQCPATYTFDGTGSWHELGMTVSGVGDVDGDGCDDILAAAPGYAPIDSTNPPGRVYLYSGATGQTLRTWTGEGGGFGIGLSGVGDVDRDGTPDVLVGARVFTTAAGLRAGKVFLYSGRTGELLRSWEGDVHRAYFGDSIAGPGDLDGDGYPDIVVGQPMLILERRAGFSGRTKATRPVITWAGPSPGRAISTATASPTWRPAGDGICRVMFTCIPAPRVKCCVA
ncbi:MAG: VCBS repeat-containing protein [Planctomycetes bacterium]|nr:VCBS repeat-containing protein [Planctomycetota bacterium]